MFHMQKQRRLPEEHARFYSAEIILALHFLHDKGIIYRDLKLDNVLLDSEGHIKLTDYGMCKEGIRDGETTGTFCGTPNYIAPEILRGEEYDFSVDWWALGVLMFEMMAGRSPFDVMGIPDQTDTSTEEYLFQVILEKVIRIPRSLSHPASNVLKGFLNKNPQDRLGCNPENGFNDILVHKFFQSVNWEALVQKQINPPYRPKIDDEFGLDNFDPQFTEEPVQLTPVDSTTLQRIDQADFEGFEYINPFMMSQEDNGPPLVMSAVMNPHTWGDAMEVPDKLCIFPPGWNDLTSTPIPTSTTSLFEFENLAVGSPSFFATAPTLMTCLKLPGQELSLERGFPSPSLPAAQTTMTPFFVASRIAVNRL